MKIDKKLLILTSASILVPMLIGCLFWQQLPQTVATHFDFSNQVNGFSSRGFTVFGIPSFLLLLHWFCLFVTSKDPKSKNISLKMWHLVYWIIPLTSCLVMTAIYAQALGYAVNHVLMNGMFLGVLFIAIGNYMPKTRRNYTVGIRFPWTLDNDDNWIKTHRLAGKIWVIGGIIIFFNGFVQIAVTFVLVFTLIIMIVVPMIYSYWLSKRIH